MGLLRRAVSAARQLDGQLCARKACLHLHITSDFRSHTKGFEDLHLL